jgi:anti-sigma factor RsiW
VDHDNIGARLSAYKDGEIHGSLRDRIERHLEACDACREELERLDRIDSLVRELPAIVASEDFTSEINSKAQPSATFRYRLLSLPHRILDRFLFLGDSAFVLFRGHQSWGDSLDEFGDFPPLSLGHAYFQLIGQ